MKRILGSLVLAFMVASMLTACGSSDQASPVLYDLFDTYESSSFPQLPWISYTRTLNDSWTADHWSIANDGSANYWAYLYYPNDLTSIQNSAFIDSNYDKTDVDCDIRNRMSINGPDLTTVQLGVILRASDTSGSYAHYAFVYMGATSVPTVEIQKVAEDGTITTLGTASIASYAVTAFDPTVLHTFQLSVSGTTTLTFIAYIDGVQQLPAVYDENGATISPANNPITDDGTVSNGDGHPVYHSGYAGFFVENANTASIYRFSIWEP
jgi:hypothetical protein